jgi:hypothetical protein
MLRVEESIVIARTPKETWDYVTDPAHDTVWVSNVVEYMRPTASRSLRTEMAPIARQGSQDAGAK